ncbi:MAG: hypothetical protein ACK5QW_04855 [Cyanobacteriota bacterium]
MNPLHLERQQPPGLSQPKFLQPSVSLAYAWASQSPSNRCGWW